MLEKFIETSQVCLTLGRPTALGFLILIVLVIIAGIGFMKSRR